MTRPVLPAGMTPRLLTAEQAAAYCGIGRENFEARVGVPPLQASLATARSMISARSTAGSTGSPGSPRTRPRIARSIGRTC